MPTVTNEVFKQEEVRAVADAAMCGESAPDVDVYLYGELYAGKFYLLVRGENSIPQAVVLKCRFLEKAQDRVNRYLLFYLDGEDWVLDKEWFTRVSPEDFGPNPSFKDLRDHGLFDPKN